MNNEIAIAILFSLFWLESDSYIYWIWFISIVGGYIIGKTNAEKYV